MYHNISHILQAAVLSIVDGPHPYYFDAPNLDLVVSINYVSVDTKYQWSRFKHTRAIIQGTPSDFLITASLCPLPSVNLREERYFIGEFRVVVLTTPMYLQPRPIKV